MMYPKRKKERSLNTMTIDEFKMAFPKKKWSQPERSKTMVAECSEDNLQEYANDAIELRRWEYLRFPNRFMAWMKLNTPPWIQKIFFGQVGGKLPDNFILAPLGNGLFLGLKMELKTQDKKGRAVGKTHGKQKRYAEAEGWPIVRSPEQIEAELNKFDSVIMKVKKEMI